MSKRKKCLISCMICILILGCIIGFSGVKKTSKGSMNAENYIRVQNDTQYIQYAYTVKNIDGKDYATNVYIQGVYSDQQSDMNNKVALTTNVVVPNELNGYPVYSIGDGGYCNNITDYSDGFFKDNDIEALINIDFSNCKSLYRLNDGCFVNQSYVVVVVPKNIKFVGKDCFSYTSKTTVKCQNPNICFEGNTTNIPNNFVFEPYVYSGAKEFYGNRAKTAYGNENSVVKFTLGCSVDSNFSQENVLNTYAWVVMDDESMADTATVNVPVLQHRDFQGYFTEPDGKGTQIFDSEGKLVFKNLDQTKFTGSVELYAYHTLREAEITFHKNLKGSKDTEVHTAVYSCDFPKTSFSETGYTLKFWNTKSDGSGETIALSGITDIDNVERGSNNAIKTLYAQWSANRYKIHYDVSSATKYTGENDVIMTYDSKYSEYKAPVVSRKGYDFEGWCLDEKCKEVITNDTTVTVTEDSTLYPKWKVHYYDIAFDAGGGSGTMASIKSIAYNETVKLPKCTFTKKGYTFDSWNEEYKDESDVYGLAESGVATLTATWKPITTKVSYFIDGSVYKDDTKDFSYTESCEYDQDFYTLSCQKDLSGCDFIGWSTKEQKVYELAERDKAFKAVKYEFGKKYAFNETEDIILYPVWVQQPRVKVKGITKDLTVRLEGLGNLTIPEEGVAYPYGTKFSAVIYVKCDPRRFIKSVEMGSTQLKCDGEEIVEVETTTADFNLTEDQIITVESPGKQHSIVYNTKAAKIEGTDYDTTYRYGEAIKLPSNVKIGGLKLVGWKEMTFYNSFLFSDLNGNVIPAGATEMSGPLEFMPIYENQDYNITYDLNGGKIVGEDKFVYKYKYFDLGLIYLETNVKREGYYFYGWYCREKNAVISQIDPREYGDLHLKALWNAKGKVTSVATLVNNDGTEKQINMVTTPMHSNSWYYNRLNDVEKKIYTTIYNFYKFDMNKGHCETQSIKLISKEKITTDNIYNAGTAIKQDNPDIFWIWTYYPSQVEKDGDVYTCGVHPHFSYKESIFKADALEFRGFINTLSKQLEENGINNKIVYDKVKLIHDLVVSTYSYRNGSNILDSNTTNETRSIGYMMTHKEGCCVSYAKMIKYLCDRYNIPCVTVGSIDHMWNEIQIGDKWYLLDATWDDAGTTVNYNYFLKGFNAVTDSHHQILNSYFENSDGTPITAYGCFDVPKIEANDYFLPVVTDGNVNNKNTKAAVAKVTTVTKGGVVYSISGKNAVVSKVTNKKLKKATVLAKVKIGKKTYKVVGINKNVFKGCKKLKSVTIKSTTLKQIGSNTFKGCKNLKKITIKSKKIKKVGKNAFKGIHKKAVFKVPKKQKKKYTKLLKKAGLKKTMKVK